MNIFYVDDDPVVAARMLNDTHVMSTIREGLTMLACWFADRENQGWYIHLDEAERKTAHLIDLPWPKLSHMNHPMTKWVRSRIGNARWLVSHTLAALDEYRRRFKKQDTFERAQAILPVLDEWFVVTYWKVFRGRPPACVPDEYKVEGDVILSYQLYYIHEKQQLGKWTSPGQPPEWLNMLEVAAEEEKKKAERKAKIANLTLAPKKLSRGKDYVKPQKKSIAGLKL